MSTELLTLAGRRDPDKDDPYSCDLTVSQHYGGNRDGTILQLTPILDAGTESFHYTQLTRHQVKLLHRTLEEFLETTK